MPAQKIDRAALAEMGVGRFGDDSPACLVKSCRGGLNQFSVPPIKWSIELAASPEHRWLVSRTKRSQDRTKRPHGDAREVTALDSRDRGLVDATARGEIGLPPAETSPKRANDCPDT